MIKIIYFSVLLVYLTLGVVYFSKFEISYRIVKVRPELVEKRSLTQDEVKALDRAYKIRVSISNVFIFASILIALISFALLKYDLFSPTWLLKVVLVISLLIGLILIIANGINFIPGPPPQ